MSAAKNEKVLETGPDVLARTKHSNKEGTRARFTISGIEDGRQTAAQLLIRSLVQQNVKHIFGIPGGKTMPTFDVLRDEGPQPDFGNPDIVKYAESFGGVGLRVNKPDELVPTLSKALETPGVVVVDIPTDYSANIEIDQQVLPEAWD